MAISEHLQSVLPQKSRSALRTSVLPSLLESISKIAETLRTVQNVTLAGSANTFGDDQLNVDVLAEDHIREALSRCPSVVTASSEEDPVEKAVVHEKGSQGQGVESYTVAFDPLDGSSIIAPNWTVGAIFGIWDGETAIGQNPRQKQIASILGVLGPRSTAIVALRVLDSPPVCFEVGLGGSGWELVRPQVQLVKPPFKTRYFAPANMRAAADNSNYKTVITTFIDEKYTLRYAGGLVPDLVHALVKGHGVYISPVYSTSSAKLRRLYELFPVALIIECAGGMSKDPMDGKGILDHVLSSTDERAGICCGNVEEVEKVLSILNS